jgi:hypothetical protein
MDDRTCIQNIPVTKGIQNSEVMHRKRKRPSSRAATATVRAIHPSRL